MHSQPAVSPANSASVSSKHVLVLGGTGLVGSAAARHFARQSHCRVTAVSRRLANLPPDVEQLALDLDDEAACRLIFGQMTGVTHVVYAAVQEEPNLVSGWSSTEHVERNGRMLGHVLGPLEQAAP